MERDYIGADYWPNCPYDTMYDTCKHQRPKTPEELKERQKGEKLKAEQLKKEQLEAQKRKQQREG